MQVDIITVCYCGVPMAGVRSKESGNEGWQAARLLPIPAPSFEGQQNAAHAEDGRFQPAADLQRTVDGKRGQTVGTRCRVSGAGASAWWLVARGYQNSHSHCRLSMMY